MAWGGAGERRDARGKDAVTIPEEEAGMNVGTRVEDDVEVEA